MEIRKKFVNPATNFTLDISGLFSIDQAGEDLVASFTKVHAEMKKIEAGEIKNPDEGRKVTHFSDRASYPKEDLFVDVETFAQEVREGMIKGGTGKVFKNFVVNGIGGSALGPQLMQFAVNGPYWNELSEEKRRGWLRMYFTDNTDTSGLTDVLNVVDLEETMILSISKSGGTRETYNNMKAFEQAYEAAGLKFADYATAITMVGSKLDKISQEEEWLKVFPMAESIGGRTSECSIVGHLPAALTGVDFRTFLDGASQMDTMTRSPEVYENPAYMLAACWFAAGGGKGDKNMVIVPYSDRLVLLSRYLQQLVMESLGKELDLDGNTVHQGLNVFGNKGGTDAHAFIQQLNDGRNDFFITFIEVLKDARTVAFDDGFEMGDYLHAFRAGLSNALRSNEREVIEIAIPDINEFYLGMLIALYERAVAAYAELINVNAFHQPGVQSYKLAANAVNDVNEKVQKFVAENADFVGTGAEVAEKIGADAVAVTGVLCKFAANEREVKGVKVTSLWNFCKADWLFSFK